MDNEYLLITEWFDEEVGEWKPIISKRPVIKTKENEDESK